MKPLSYSLLAAALACGFASAQTTAYTVPVGYVTLDVTAASDTVVGPCLNRASVIETTAVISASSTTVTLNISGVTLDQFKYAPPQTNHYYLQFRSGGLAGQIVPIVGNDASVGSTAAFTVSEAVAITAADRVAVIPFHTLDTFFPGGAGVGTQDDPGNSLQNVMFIDPGYINNPAGGVNLNPVPSKIFSYYDGSQGGDAGWYGVGSGSPEGDTPIDPNQLMLIRNSSATARQVVQTGEVPREAVVSPVYKEEADQDNTLVFVYPLNTALSDSGLCTVTPVGGGGYTFSGPVSPVDDPGKTTGDSILLFNYQEITAENPTNLLTAPETNPNATAQYVMYDGSQGGAAEWYNVKGYPENPFLQAGRGMYIRKASGSVTALPWVRNMPYTLP